MRTPTIAVGVLSALLVLSPAFSAIASTSSATQVAEQSASPAPSATPTPAVSPAPTPAPSPAPKHNNTTTYIIIGVVVVAAIILISANSVAHNLLPCGSTPNCTNSVTGSSQRGPELGLQFRFR